jgi:hypothetical protein
MFYDVNTMVSQVSSGPLEPTNLFSYNNTESFAFQTFVSVTDFKKPGLNIKAEK